MPVTSAGRVRGRPDVDRACVRERSAFCTFDADVYGRLPTRANASILLVDTSFACTAAEILPLSPDAAVAAVISAAA